MKNIAKIITIFGGVKGLYASIDNEPFMRLVIEDIGQAHADTKQSVLLIISCRTATFAKTPRWPSN